MMDSDEVDEFAPAALADYRRPGGRDLTAAEVAALLDAHWMLSAGSWLLVACARRRLLGSSGSPVAASTLHGGESAYPCRPATRSRCAGGVAIPVPCSTCSHPARLEIDRTLASAVPLAIRDPTTRGRA